MHTESSQLVEIFVPTYNRPNRLLTAVRSALDETPFRVTVLDDCSDEPAEAVLMGVLSGELASRVRVVRNRLNLGANLNILRSLELSRSPYTWVFADDQKVVPFVSGSIVEAIERHPDAAFFLWHAALELEEELLIPDLETYIELIERGRAFFGFADPHVNVIMRTGTASRYVKVDSRFSHAMPTVGLQVSALGDGECMVARGGSLHTHADSPSGWSVAYAQRFKLDVAYLIADERLRRRYLAVVAEHFPWRVALIDLPRSRRGSPDEAFAIDAATLIAHAHIPIRLRIEAQIALLLSRSIAGRLLASLLPCKENLEQRPDFERTSW